MPPLNKCVVLAEPAGSTPAGRILQRLGYRVEAMDLSAVDAAAQAPEQLTFGTAAEGGPITLVVAIAAQSEGAAAAVDWDGMVHNPLQRCFTIVRGLVPALLGRPEGGHVIFSLPSAAFFADARHCADSVLGRALMGFAEGLAAELLPTPVGISIVLANGTADEPFARALRSSPLYAVSAKATEQRVADTFAPWLDELARTPSDLAMPPMGPMGDVYRSTGADRAARQPDP